MGWNIKGEIKVPKGGGEKNRKKKTDICGETWDWRKQPPYILLPIQRRGEHKQQKTRNLATIEEGH